jgi:carboxyl-terminal processing protease
MRRGEELIDFNIERARIEIPNVETELLEGNIGYISMAEFSSVARAQVDAALDEFEPDALNGLVFDLRGNPGGLLSAATEIAGLFLDEGIILIEDFGDGDKEVYEIHDGVVMQTLADGTERTYTTNAAYRDLDMPVVVLIDERSASASELVAGAWQDHGVVTLVGTTSFGKGTVQLQNTLSNGGGMRLTVARWLTPKGAWISEQGVTPDIVVEIPEDVELTEGEDPQLKAAVDFLSAQIQVDQSQ